MDQRKLASEIIATYQKHGWRLRRILLRPETLADFPDIEDPTFDGARMEEAAVDAIWFSRPSHGNREAWELRLLAENQYALFETFDNREPEGTREEVRRKMEAQLCDYANGRPGEVVDI